MCWISKTAIAQDTHMRFDYRLSSIKSLLLLLMTFCALFTGTIPYAFACDVMSTPTKAGRSQWYCSNSSSTVTIFVHGLNSNSVDSWTHIASSAGSGEVFWPRLVITDPVIAAVGSASVPPSVLLASYHTGPSSGNFRIADAQRQIADSLFISIDGQPPAINKRTIIFVAHSLGGVLTRDLLARHANRFAGKRVGVLLVASPSRGSSFANLARYAQWAFNNPMVRELEQGSMYLDEVHRRFVQALNKPGALKNLVGRELYEHLSPAESAARCTSNSLSIFGLLCAVRQNVAGWINQARVVSRDSAVVYWPETQRLIAQSDHSTIAQPTDHSHQTHLALRELIGAVHQAEVSQCKPPPGFSLALKMADQHQSCQIRMMPGMPSKFELLQLDVGDARPTRRKLPLTFDPIAKVYRLNLSEQPFPCINDVFWGKILPAIQSTHLTGTHNCLTDICFRRSRRTNETSFAFLRCIKGDKCIVPARNAGLADSCRETDRSLIMVGDKNKRARATIWASPSLNTLENMPASVRPGYTEFHVISDPITHLLDVTNFGFGVYVNGQEVRFDNLPPFFARVPLSPGSRVHLTFPIENLGFRGGRGDGYEDVQLAIKFFRRELEIETAVLRRPYVAYRHGETIRKTNNETGETFSWRAIYRPSTSGQDFEVMLEHGSSAAWMNDRRSQLDALEKSFRGQPVTGVIRPGREENRRIGMIIGLVQYNGQVRSLFTKDEAEDICRWVVKQQDFNRLQTQLSYIFEFPRETFDNINDRGRRISYCRDT